MAKRGMKIVHRAPVVSKARYERLVHARKAAVGRAKAMGQARAGSLVGIAACAAVGYAEKNGKMPSLGGFEPTLVAGIALGFLLPSVVKGKMGQMSAEAGAALCGVAAYKLGTGAPIRVGEDEYDD